MPSTCNSTKVLLNNRPSTSNTGNNAFSNPNRYSKRKKLVSAVDKSSCIEGTEIVHGSEKPTLRALSDYESGDNDVGVASNSLTNVSKLNKREVTKKTTPDNVCFASIQFEDSCSSDSDELFVRLNSKRGSTRALSDYETGDSIDQATGSFLSYFNKNFIGSTNSSLQNLDLSSENDSVYKVILNKCKRPCNLFSTSDSSDSDTPLKQQSFRKRKRINSTSEESDDNIVNTVQSHRRCKLNQNDLLRTNRSIGYLGKRVQETRPNNQRRYTETESDSSSDEMLSKMIRGEKSKTESGSFCNRVTRLSMRDKSTKTENGSSSDEMLSKMMRGKNSKSESDSTSDGMSTVVSDEIEEYSTTLNVGSNSSQHNLMEGFSDAQLNRTRSANERSTGLIQHTATRRRIRTRRARQLRLRNNGLEALRISSLERESETSSDDNNSRFRRPIRVTRFDSVSPPLQSYVDSSDINTILPFKPRRVRGGSVQICYSDSDSNSEQTQPNIVHNSNTDNSDVSPNPLIPSIIQDEKSSDSDADSEKCPICFSCFGSKEVANPESCDHSFCTKCIQEWSKNNNTCPIDRQKFNKIIVRPSFNIDGEVIREILVESPQVSEGEVDPMFDVEMYVSSPEEEEEDICCVCNSGSNSHNLIFCDFCNSIYHMSCLTPQLRYVPASDWFCPLCVELGLDPDL